MGKEGPELREDRVRTFAQDQVLVFGATTSANSGSSWSVRRAYYDSLNRLPKVVFSSTLEEPLGWRLDAHLSGCGDRGLTLQLEFSTTALPCSFDLRARRVDGARRSHAEARVHPARARGHSRGRRTAAARPLISPPLADGDEQGEYATCQSTTAGRTLDRDRIGRPARRSVTVMSGRMPRRRRRRGARTGPGRRAASAGRRGGGRAARP